MTMKRKGMSVTSFGEVEASTSKRRYMGVLLWFEEKNTLLFILEDKNIFWERHCYILKCANYSFY